MKTAWAKGLGERMVVLLLGDRRLGHLKPALTPHDPLSVSIHNRLAPPVFLTTLVINLMGSALRDWLDPHMKL